MARERETLAEIIATNVKALREARELSQRQLAAKAKTDPKNVSNIERAAHSPSMETLEAIARVFSIEPWRLLRPGAERALPADDDAERLQQIYSSANDRERDAILRVAEMTSGYGEDRARDDHKARAEQQGSVERGRESLQRGGSTRSAGSKG